MLIISNIKLKPLEKEEILRNKILKKLKINSKDLLEYQIYQKSIDARNDLVFVYSLLVKLKNEDKFLKYKDVKKYEEIDLSVEKVNSDKRPIIVGYGPSGIFSAIRLIEAGIKPIIIERGSEIDKRVKTVDAFFNGEEFDEECNVQYGEGGAGTFSDAKLTTRVKDPFIKYILDVLIKFGADKEIAYESHPHIGTDNIRKVIKNITSYLKSEGVDFYFDEKVIDIKIVDGEIDEVITNKQVFKCDYLLLGMGHSAYDLFKALDKRGVYLESKDFSVGFRCEHPQSFINNNQYKAHVKELSMYPAEYFLRAKTSLDKGVYSFCMCPGGYVVPSNSEFNSIVTNGMSYSKRDNDKANSAILCQVDKSDFGEELFGGFDYIHNLETNAYKIDNSYKAIAQNIKDFMNNDLNELIFESTYIKGTKLYNFNNFYSPNLVKAFKEAFLHFDKLIPGFIEKGIMVGPETRSSCPIRIKRNENLESVNTKGIYPMGEGAGYAGGIVSSALDGIRIANKIIKTLH